MNRKIKLYDVVDNNNIIINSQVIVDNNIGFEIPRQYYFVNDTTDNNTFHITNDKTDINISFELFDENIIKGKLESIRNNLIKVESKTKITENFNNYRNQKIMEYEENNCINVIGYDEHIIISANSKCKKYSYEYFDLYYIVFSFIYGCNGEYDNLSYQKNNYCILKNGKYIYETNEINILKTNPIDLLISISNKNFCQSICENKEYDKNIDYYYIPKAEMFRKIVKRIENIIISEDNDNPDCMDLIVE